MKKRVISLLVDNTAGVTQRVSGLFSRRGYNIESITGGETADPRYSRITVVAEGDDDVLEQITKQLRKLVDVVDLKVLDPENSVTRELVLVKIKVSPEQRQSVITMADVFRGKVVDVGYESRYAVTGKISAVVGLPNNFERKCALRLHNSFKKRVFLVLGMRVDAFFKRRENFLYGLTKFRLIRIPFLD